jgi:acetoin utilization deacetylase AcuC-like enzyme
LTTGFIFDQAFLSHHTGAGHPECAQRLSATMAHLDTLPWFEDLKQLDALPVARDLIETSHSSAYLGRARQSCLGGSAFLDSMDTVVSEESFDIALRAAGAAIALADGVMVGEISNGFALVRPATMPSRNRPWGSVSSTM